MCFPYVLQFLSLKNINASDVKNISYLLKEELKICMSPEWEIHQYSISIFTTHFSQIALMLLENGADPNATDKLESTPLHRASAKGNYRLIQLLLKQSASTNIQDSQGNTALYV